MGVCCGRSINQPISNFINKAKEKKINIGDEELFEEAVVIAQEYKSEKFEMGEIVEISEKSFLFTDNFHQFGLSNMYSFYAKDDKGEIYRCNVIISKTDKTKYDCRIYKANEDSKSSSTKSSEMKNTSPLRNATYSTPVSYKLARTDKPQSNEINNINNLNIKNSPSSTKPEKTNYENSSKPISPIRVNSTRNSYSPTNSQKQVTKTFEINLNSVNPFKTIKEESKNPVTISNSISSNNKAYSNFKEKASKKNVNYGKEFYFTKAIQLIEKQGKQILEIETTNFHYSDNAMSIYGKSYRYQFNIIDTMNIRYSCDIIIAINGRDNIVKIIPYMTPIDFKRISKKSLENASPKNRKSK